MGKRANDEGSITKRKSGVPAGRWEGAVATPNGRKHVYAKTQRECQQKVRALLRQVEEGLPAPLCGHAAA